MSVARFTDAEIQQAAAALFYCIKRRGANIEFFGDLPNATQAFWKEAAKACLESLAPRGPILPTVEMKEIGMSEFYSLGLTVPDVDRFDLDNIVAAIYTAMEAKRPKE